MAERGPQKPMASTDVIVLDDEEDCSGMRKPGSSNSFNTVSTAMATFAQVKSRFQKTDSSDRTTDIFSQSHSPCRYG